MGGISASCHISNVGIWSESLGDIIQAVQGYLSSNLYVSTLKVEDDFTESQFHQQGSLLYFTCIGIGQVGPWASSAKLL